MSQLLRLKLSTLMEPSHSSRSAAVLVLFAFRSAEATGTAGRGIFGPVRNPGL